MKKPVSHRALLARLNRKLKAESKQVHRLHHGSRSLGSTFKTPYILVEKDERITEHNLDLEKYGRKLEVLKPYEKLEEK